MGQKHHIRVRKGRFFTSMLLIILSIAVIVFIVIKLVRNNGSDNPNLSANITPTPTIEEVSPTPEPTPTPMYTPRAVADTDPSVLGVVSELNLNGEDVDSYTRPESFSFGSGDSYAPDIDGIISFRGNHWRQNASVGDADITNQKLELVWSIPSGSLPKGYVSSSGSTYWTGSGWTGQPLIVKWPEATRNIMNLNDAKKNKSDLVEVIYATMDGTIYFLDLEDGEKTRSNINIGTPFKGAGSLDPRGYPIIYLGSGDSVPAHSGKPAMSPEFFIYSLITGEKLYSFGKHTDSYAQRNWTAYDAASLVDAGTDTLIVPGENGIIYTLKLNTTFDIENGTLSMSPSDMLKMRYTTARSRQGKSNNTYWLGVETSPVMWRHYLYIGDNCGTMLCIDTDTMTVVWAQNVLDDTNSTPVLEEIDGKPYLYIAPSLHWTKSSNSTGTVPVWKIDGLTGEILWQTDFDCYTVKDVSGGVEASGLLGKGDIDNLVFYTVARIPTEGSGILVALDKNTGTEVWRFSMNRYGWSSPVAIYDKNGKGYIIQCDTGGRMFLLDGKTGTMLYELDLGSNIEASPAVYGDMIVVGTRGQKICGVKIS